MEASLLHDVADLPSGASLVEDGMALGARIEAGRSAFCQRRDVSSEVDFKRSRIATGELQWSMIMGLASLEDQIEALGFLERFGERTGVVIDRGLIIPNWVTGLPERLRERAPKGMSFVLGGVEDHVRIAQAAAIMPCFNDFHIGSPAAVPNTLAAIQAGGSYMGVLAQYVWSLPYMDTDVALVAENGKAIAIVAQKWSEGVVVDSYLDDGMPAEFADNVSMIGYACLERYVVERLCGARYATGFGQLISDIPTKLSIWLALAEVLQEIADIHAAARSAAAKSRDLEGLLDYSAVEADRDVLVEQGRRFFENALRVLAELGVDVSDPLQTLLGLRRLGAQRLEQLCHPGQRDDAMPNGIVPFSPTEFTKRSSDIIRSEVERIRSAGIADVIRGQPFIVGSADTHVYGKFVVAGVLRALGGEVVDAGVDRDPEHFAALLSRRADRPAVAISTHNGQCVSYARQLMTLLPAHDRPDVFIGGKLNTIADGDSEPRDASQLLREMGVIPCRTIADLAGYLSGMTRA
jgi:methylmalonyl-CoA mutase cobalamin-binding subunit